MSSIDTKLRKGLKILTNSDDRFLILSPYGFYNKIPDEEYLKKLFKLRMGYELNLDDPKTACEKIQWLKLYNRKPEYTMMVDKYRVKDWVSSKIGEEHVIPLYGVWDSYEDIDWDSLPNEFVLKCNHDGGVVVCKDKNTFDKNKYRKHFRTRLRRNYFWSGREWAYKDVKRCIIAEKYIDSLGARDSVEYKISCCDGVVKIITICTGIAHDSFDVRNNDHYDRDWNYLPFYAYYKNTGNIIEKPVFMDDVIKYCEILSQGIPHVRVDGYVVDNNWLFGEMTFYTWNGFIEFTPKEWDLKLGQWLDLPKEKTL